MFGLRLAAARQTASTSSIDAGTRNCRLANNLQKIEALSIILATQLDNGPLWAP